MAAANDPRRRDGARERAGDAVGRAADAARNGVGAAAGAARAGAGAAAHAGAGAVARVKPKLRGVTHQYAFFVALAVGTALVIFAPNAEARIACAIYAASVAGLFGTSALYHRVNWSPRARRWMRRLDHTMIFVLIAGTYTPFALLALDGPFATLVLAGVWGGALGGTILQLVWIDSPKWLSAVVYVALGWFAVVAMPALLDELGVVPIVLVGTGGAFYTAGAVIYALQRPDPAPAVFGYHEIFHVLVIAAAAVQFAAIAFFVLPNV